MNVTLIGAYRVDRHSKTAIEQFVDVKTASGIMAHLNVTTNIERFAIHCGVAQHLYQMLYVIAGNVLQLARYFSPHLNETLVK